MVERVKLYDPEGGFEISVAVATSMRERIKGLRGKDDLPPGKGFLIRTKQVHTVGMSFPIDAIYISRTGRVVRVSTMSPGKVGPIVPAAVWVLEVAAGEAHRLGISAGSELVMKEEDG